MVMDAIGGIGGAHPSVMLGGDKCELEVKEVAPSEMVSHVLVVVEGWFPYALIVLPML